jgi:hypothetical protein
MSERQPAYNKPTFFTRNGEQLKNQFSSPPSSKRINFEDITANLAGEIRIIRTNNKN